MNAFGKLSAGLHAMSHEGFWLPIVAMGFFSHQLSIQKRAQLSILRLEVSTGFPTTDGTILSRFQCPSRFPIPQQPRNATSSAQFTTIIIVDGMLHDIVQVMHAYRPSLTSLCTLNYLRALHGKGCTECC